VLSEGARGERGRAEVRLLSPRGEMAEGGRAEESVVGGGKEDGPGEGDGDFRGDEEQWDQLHGAAGHGRGAPRGCPGPGRESL